MDGRRFLAAACCALAFTPAARAGFLDGKDDLLEPFLATPDFVEASLSPDGTRLLTTGYDAQQRPRTYLTNLDTNVRSVLPPFTYLVWSDAPGKPRAQERFSMPSHPTWVDDAHFVVDYRGKTHSAEVFGRDGKWIKSLGHQFLGMLRPDGAKSMWAMARIDDMDSHESDVARLLSLDDQVSMKRVDLGLPDAPRDWVTDASGTVRIARLVRGTKASASWTATTWYRDGEGAPWHQVDERSVADDPYRPVSVDGRPGRILVLTRNGQDHDAIWSCDVERRACTDVVVSDPDADIVRSERTPDGSGIEAVTSDGLRTTTHWFDPRMARLQAAVDAALPDHVNAVHAGRSRRLLVESSSDRDPGRLFVLDTETLKMQLVAVRNAAVDPSKMQPMQAIHYPAADGLSVPAFLTLPGRPARPAPMVVLIHGGPQVRDHWGWDEEAQIYAAHGYVVFQPQFRGSSGFGKRFEEAGYGQFGLAMQDDVTAGVRYLIDRKIADPDRICIVGGSYGGYAALWGLVKTPSLYRCGVARAAPTDLQRLLTSESDVSQSAETLTLLHRRIGDPAVMKDRFDEVSPVRHAADIQVPVLLVHGTLDARVPVSHGRQMRDALLEHGKDVTWLEFPDEAHGIARIDDLRTYYDAVFALLKRTIGRGTPP